MVILGNFYSDDNSNENLTRVSKLITPQVFNSLFLKIPIALIEFNLNSNYLFGNKYAQRLLGHTQNDFKKTDVLSLIFPEDRGLFSEFKHSLMNKRSQLLRLEIRFIKKNHEVFWGVFSIQPIETKNSTELFFIASIENVTHLRSMELEIERQRMTSKHASKLASLGELTAGIAHEINNPLAIISGAADQLEKFHHDPIKFKSKVNTIIQNTARLTKIVGGLKKYSRSAISPKSTRLNLSHVLKESIALTEGKAKRHGVQVNLDLASDYFVLGDEVEFEQVFINLINNAIDAVKTYDDRWVKIKSTCDESNIVLQIIDSGNGIPFDLEKNLFEPFFTTKAEGHGTGLGLSIVKSILIRHQSTIKINREIQNTCFEIRLPILSESPSGSNDLN